ncbi:hypothetical protein MJO28_014587 [Puccinia striiformis f. sp. tritici]|uniref:Uncharacterized protein n=1 Tax=Puccinia striiformis f. sp. tritici TaxID=168172 RepID=A0ACC0DVR5_9BASI|nr:hypothetical protein MJO28_014587 [Puccinia striiformis f. sp. tritici]
MIIHAAATILFLSLLTESTQPDEHHQQSGRRHTLGRRGLLQNLLGGSPPGGSAHPNNGIARPLTDSNPVGGPRSYTGGGIPPTTLAGLIGGRDPNSGTGGILDGVSSLLPLGGGSPGGGVNDILNGVPRFKPAVSTATPRPTTTRGDAPWTQSESAYRQMITCPSGLRGRRGVVLLIPPTGGNGQQAWSRSPYAQYLPRQGFSPCWVDNPTKSTGDVQLTAEYVAYAIKYLSTQSGQPISIVSFSQGGLDVHAMALTFWPSAARVVRNFVALAAPFHGTTLASVVCPLLDVIGGCLPALFQMISSSRLVKALNAPVPGSGARALVPTTSVYSRNDEIVVPQTGSRPISALDGASNIAVQDICGVTHVADHFLLIGDLAAYSIAVDALMSGRPANPATVDKSHCNQLDSLGGQAASLGNDLKYAFATLIGNTNDRISSLLKTATTLTVPGEPSLQLYVCRRGFATGCTGNGFSAPQDRDPLLNNLPTMVNGVGSLLGGLVR